MLTIPTTPAQSSTLYDALSKTAPTTAEYADLLARSAQTERDNYLMYFGTVETYAAQRRARGLTEPPMTASIFGGMSPVLLLGAAGLAWFLFGRKGR